MGKHTRTRQKIVTEDEDVTFCNSCGQIMDDLSHVVVDAAVERKQHTEGRISIRDGEIVEATFMSQDIDFESAAEAMNVIGRHGHGRRSVAPSYAGLTKFEQIPDHRTMEPQMVDAETVDWREVKSALLTMQSETEYRCSREAHLCDSCIELIFEYDSPRGRL